MSHFDARNDKSVRNAWRQLGTTISLNDFLSSVDSLSDADKHRIVEQAIVLIEQLFAHLKLKEARHAVNPLQRLRLLQQQIAVLDDSAFHWELTEIFKGLRDAHTNYGLPRPYAGKVAFLPFLVERYFDEDEDQPRFLVTQLIFGLSHQKFKEGVEITHWNGTPMQRAVQVNANREEGSNPAAQFAFGLAAMTLRDLGSSLPPDEEWVIITFRSGSQVHEITFPWRVWDRDVERRPDLSGGDNAVGNERFSMSDCSRVREMHSARKYLFARNAVKADKLLARTRLKLDTAGKALGDVSLGPKKADSQTESLLPTVLGFDIYQHLGKEFGYIRIRTFGHSPISEFFNEFLRILDRMPGDGLILDVRGNGGGFVMNGELLLQLFTPRPVQPEPFHFISSPLTQEICSTPAGLDPDILAQREGLAETWGKSLQQTVQTGEVYSKGFPLTEPRLANLLGQRYHGPVVLITDAMCYSTTDIFAAGFQDHEIGDIIGVDANTGAGGANVWEHAAHLVGLLPSDESPIQPLPADTTMRVAIRRSTRVGPNAGQPLEDLGVRPTILHRMTRDDLLRGNIDLITEATELLATKVSRQLDAEVTSQTNHTISVALTLKRLDRLDCRVNGRPTLSIDVTDGVNHIVVPAFDDPELLELRGFENGEFVAARKIVFG